MTYEEACRRVANRTGLPYRVVRQVMDTFSALMVEQLKNGGEVHFRGLLKLQTFTRKIGPSAATGPLGVERTETRIRAWPMPGLREEMSRWKSTASEPTKNS